MILDILLCAFLLFLFIRGWRLGFIRSLFGFVGVLASGILTKFLYQPFTRLLCRLPFYQKVSDHLNQTANIKTEELFPPELIEKLGLSDTFSSASDGLVSILTYVVLFLLIFLALSLLSCLLDGMFKLPVLKSVNRFFGLLFNGLKGVMLCYLLAVILYIFRADIVADSYVLNGLLNAVPGLANMLF